MRFFISAKATFGVGLVRVCRVHCDGRIAESRLDADEVQLGQGPLLLALCWAGLRLSAAYGRELVWTDEVIPVAYSHRR